MKKLSVILVVAIAALALSCGGGKTEYRDVNKDEGSREFGPKEIKMTCEKITASMVEYLKNDWKKAAFLQVKKFRNKTSEHIDAKMITDQIANSLIKKKIKFIDEDLTEDAMKEMEKGMSGMIDPNSAIPAGNLKSPNFYITGDINDNVRTVGGKTIQYLVVTFRLVRLETGVAEWQEQQEFLKASKKTKVQF